MATVAMVALSWCCLSTEYICLGRCIKSTLSIHNFESFPSTFDIHPVQSNILFLSLSLLCCLNPSSYGISLYRSDILNKRGGSLRFVGGVQHKSGPHNASKLLQLRYRTTREMSGLFFFLVLFISIGLKMGWCLFMCIYFVHALNKNKE